MALPTFAADILRRKDNTLVGNTSYATEQPSSATRKTSGAVKYLAMLQNQLGATGSAILGKQNTLNYSPGAAAIGVGSNGSGAAAGTTQQTTSTPEPYQFKYTDAQKPAEWTDTTQKPGAFSYDGTRPADNNYTGNRPEAYQAPEAPSPYKSQYTEQLSNLLQQLTGRGDFKYDLNSDMLYQNAKDQYMLGGRQAMMDTMGQAQAMTGGYGNSYAQSVGQQAYQQYLGKLNEMVPELYDRAYQRWQDQGNQMLQQYGLYRDAENQEYNRYQDDLNRFQQDRAFGYNQYQDQLAQYNADRNFDYGRYQDQLAQYNADRNFAYNQYQDQLNQYQADRNFDYQRYQDQLSQYNQDRNFDFDVANANRSYYNSLVQSMLSEGKWPNADLLARAGYTESDIASYLGPRPDPNAQAATPDLSYGPGYEAWEEPETVEEQPAVVTPSKKPPKDPPKEDLVPNTAPNLIPGWFGGRVAPFQTAANMNLENHLYQKLLAQYADTDKKNGTGSQTGRNK